MYGLGVIMSYGCRGSNLLCLVARQLLVPLHSGKGPGWEGYKLALMAVLGSVHQAGVCFMGLSFQQLQIVTHRPAAADW